MIVSSYGRRKSKLPWIIGIVVALLLLTIAGVCVALFVLGNKKAQEPVTKYVSVSEEASAKAYVWLAQIEDMSLEYEDVQGIMGEMKLEVVLTPTEQKGIYTQAPVEASYKECVNKAKAGLERAYLEVLKSRLLAAGFEGNCEKADMDKMMQEAYGVSVSEYLEQCDVSLLPEFTTIQEKYSGEVSNE